MTDPGRHRAVTTNEVELATQEAIRRARATVLGGRGPGASEAEVREQTRARTHLAHRPVAAVRAAVARQTARARGDPAP